MQTYVQYSLSSWWAKNISQNWDTHATSLYKRDLNVQKSTGNLVKTSWVQTLICALEKNLFYVFKEMTLWKEQSLFSHETVEFRTHVRKNRASPLTVKIHFNVALTVSILTFPSGNSQSWGWELVENCFSSVVGKYI